MIPTWAIVLIVMVIIIGMIYGFMYYYRPDIFRGGGERYIQGNIPEKRVGFLTTQAIESANK